ncbi:MAG: DUF2846 domain-containing protein [Candidatus Acidiferrales bacterium]
MNACWIVLLTVSAWPVVAQGQPTGVAAAPGCGPAKIEFDVKTEKQHPVMQPAPGKALVYFLQDDAKFESTPRPTTRFGLDGAWGGATHRNSYFYVSVDPGEHHVCANWQNFVGFGARSTAAMHFTAEAGGVYYLRARDVFHRNHPPAVVELGSLDGDEAQLLMSMFSFSTSQPKK